MSFTLLLIINGIFVNNFILAQFLGICPFLGVSKKTETALGMGIAVIFVMGVASAVTFALNLLLIKVGIEYLQTIVFILVIAGLIQILEVVLKKFTPALYSALGVYLPLITTNCAVLGVAIVNVTSLAQQTIFYAFLNGAASGAGFTVAILILAGIREKMETSDIPEPFKGFPITLITASLMAMSFAAFSSLSF